VDNNRFPANVFYVTDHALVCRVDTIILFLDPDGNLGS